MCAVICDSGPNPRLVADKENCSIVLLQPTASTSRLVVLGIHRFSCVNPSDCVVRVAFCVIVANCRPYLVWEDLRSVLCRDWF